MHAKTCPKTSGIAILLLTVVGSVSLGCGNSGTSGGSGGSSLAGAGGGGSMANGGSGSGGRSGEGGSSAAGGKSLNGGSSASGGSSTSGGSTGPSGGSGGGTATGAGGSGKGGTGVGGGAAGSFGGAGTTGTGGSAGAGGAGMGGSSADAGTSDARSADVGQDSGGSAFDPCPTNGEPCKILPLGDSITLGTNYGGGYRVKLFAHAATDQKSITFVGYDTANPPDASTLSKLGSASSKFVNKHEGHFAWTIQQVDDLITGVATSSQDGVNYTGKKIVADAKPHIVLVHIGTNDMKAATGATDRLAKLIDHVVADAPNALVVVAKIIPLLDHPNEVTAYNQAIPNIVKQRADSGKHVVLVDQYAGFEGKTGLMDVVHPFEAGYEQMATVWYEGIKPYLH